MFDCPAHHHLPASWAPRPDITDAHQKYQTLLVAHEKAERMRFDEVEAADLSNQRGYLELTDSGVLLHHRTQEPSPRCLALGQLARAAQDGRDQLMRLRRAVKDVYPDSGTPEGDSPGST